MSGHVEGAPKGLDDALGRGRYLAFACLVHEHGKFVASQPRDDSLRPDDRRETYREHRKQLVADGVAERIVDDLEAIEVEAKDRYAAPLDRRFGERGPEAGHEVGAVGQPGERIVERFVGQAPGRLSNPPGHAVEALGERIDFAHA